MATGVTCGQYFRNTQGNAPIHCRRPPYYYSHPKHKVKGLPDQRLVPAAPPGLHSAQIRHGSSLEELAQSEQLALDLDPSAKQQTHLFFEY